MRTPAFFLPTNLFRGGPDLAAQPSVDVLVDRTTGLLRTDRGVSLFSNPARVERFGGAYQVEFVPEGLKVEQRGKDPEHHELMPAEPMSLDRYATCSLRWYCAASKVSSKTHEGSAEMKTLDCPQVVFPDGFDERAAFKAPLKGWLSAHVLLADGSRCTVYFSDPVRLQQDLDESIKIGTPFFAEPGLIVLPEVSVEAVQDAVRLLCAQGFFDHLKAERSESNTMEMQANAGAAA